MVGDWVERDIVGAANVGMKTAFAKYGDTFNTIQHNANYKLNDISEIIDIILKENGL
jgi:putative hydrolase of the HAD superfamily